MRENPEAMRLAERLADTEAQRDALLGALKKAKWMLERDHIDPQKMAVIENCDAAIEAAEKI